MADLISLRIDAAEKARLSRLARDRGLTLSDALRQGAARLLEDPMDPDTTTEEAQEDAGAEVLLNATQEAEMLLSDVAGGLAGSPMPQTEGMDAHAYQGDGTEPCTMPGCAAAKGADIHMNADGEPLSVDAPEAELSEQPEQPEAAEKRPHVQPVRAAAEPTTGGWKANPLFFMDQATRDGRILASPKAAAKVDAELRGAWWTPTPKTLMAQTVNPEMGGHAGAFVAGTLPGADISMKGAKVLAAGRFNSDELGQQAQEYVNNQSLTGISVDLAPQKWQIEIQPAEGDPMMLFFAKGDEEPSPASDPIILQESVDDVTLRFLDYEVIGATLVATPAFGDAQVALTSDGKKVAIVQPGVGNVWVELATNEQGWPVPRRVVVGGMVEAWDEAPMLASSLRPHDLGGLDALIVTLDNARVAQLVSSEEARRIFANAIMEHAE